MSLIDDALRRVNDPTLPTTPSATTPAPVATPTAPTAHSWPSATAPTARQLPSSRPLMYAATAVFLLAAALGLGALAGWLKTAAPGLKLPPPRVSRPAAPAKSSPTAPAGAAATSAASAMSWLPTPKPSASGELVLSGTVAGAGQPFAMINGQIVSIGEMIGEWTLEDIADGSVTLRRTDGSQRMLQVPR